MASNSVLFKQITCAVNRYANILARSRVSFVGCFWSFGATWSSGAALVMKSWSQGLPREAGLAGTGARGRRQELFLPYRRRFPHYPWLICLQLQHRSLELCDEGLLVDLVPPPPAARSSEINWRLERNQRWECGRRDEEHDCVRQRGVESRRVKNTLAFFWKLKLRNFAVRIQYMRLMNSWVVSNCWQKHPNPPIQIHLLLVQS